MGKYADIDVLWVGFSWGVVGCDEVGSLCEALWLCGGCGLGGGNVCLVVVVYVLWLVLYG